MKKLFLIILISVVLGIFVTSCGISQEKSEIVTQQNILYDKFDYDGHTYIKFTWVFPAGSVHRHTGVVHDPDCP